MVCCLLYVDSLLTKSDRLDILVGIWLQRAVAGTWITYISFLRNRIVCDSGYHLLNIYIVPTTELKMLLVFSFNVRSTSTRHRLLAFPIREQILE